MAMTMLNSDSYQPLHRLFSRIPNMFNSHRYQPLLRFISVMFQTTSPLPFSFPFSLKFCTTTSQSHSFTVSYLINNLGFTPETALKASKRHCFETSERPDTVVDFFRSHGFSDSQVSSILRRLPQLLSCNPHKSVLPKFEFLASKGASTSDIVLAVSKSPHFLHSSLENTIIPQYGLIRTFFQSDKKALDCFVSWPDLLQKKPIKQNLKLLHDEGVRDPNIAYLIKMRTFVFHANGLRKAMDEVKELGFDPLKQSFVVASVAKLGMSKSKWNAKVEAFKSWGWSDEAIAAAFRKHPNCMLTSKDKINAMLSFWVNQLSWNSLDLALCPVLFGYSLDKRIIPRAFVVQYLFAKGLIKKNAGIITPFVMPEKLFLEKYVKIFKEETFQLLKIYHGERKLNFQDKREN